MDELRQPIVIPADAYQRRIFGFIGERMLSGFFHNHQKQRQAKVATMDVGFLSGIQLRNTSLLVWPLLRTLQLLAPSRRYIAYERRSAAGALATAAGDPSALWLPGKLPS